MRLGGSRRRSGEVSEVRGGSERWSNEVRRGEKEVR